MVTKLTLWHCYYEHVSMGMLAFSSKYHCVSGHLLAWMKTPNIVCLLCCSLFQVSIYTMSQKFMHPNGQHFCLFASKMGCTWTARFCEVV